MSWDCRLVNEKGETLELGETHNFKGGTYAVGGTKECWLNVTYNYSKYIRESKEFPEGLDSLQGKTGAESVKMLKSAIKTIKKNHMKDNEWEVKQRELSYYVNPSDDSLVSHYDMRIEDMCRWEEAKVIRNVSEGPNSNYWLPTAGNAVNALEGLIALAEGKPEGIWEIN